PIWLSCRTCSRRHLHRRRNKRAAPCVSVNRTQNCAISSKVAISFKEEVSWAMSRLSTAKARYFFQSVSIESLRDARRRARQKEGPRPQNVPRVDLLPRTRDQKEAPARETRGPKVTTRVPTRP